MNEIRDGVLREFYALTQIPRPSGQEAAVSAYLINRLQALGLQPEQDAACNIICDVPASSGKAELVRIALQAHMDMVCVGAPDYHPEADPIITQITDGWLCTDGRSSLGADCGIGLAVALYLVAESRCHGPLRLIFTADEERGLAGAKKLRRDCLSGCSALINLDSFHFGELLISSAGGLRQTFRKQPEQFFPMLEKSVRISVTGLLGGHSGDNIAEHRANAAQLLVWLLQALQLPYELASVSAGITHNAIPAEGSAVICIDEQYLEELQHTTALFLQGIQELYPTEAIQLTLTDAEKPDWVFTVDERDNLLALAGLILCGEATKHPLFPEITGSSGSLGMLQADQNTIEIRSFLRSIDPEFLAGYRDFYGLAAHGFHFEAAEEAYPGWPGLETDWLTDLFLQEGVALGIPQRKNAVHVGLETSILHALAPELPMVSVGMDIENPHSVSERVRLDTIGPFTRLLSAVLAAAPAESAEAAFMPQPPACAAQPETSGVPEP